MRKSGKAKFIVSVLCFAVLIFALAFFSISVRRKNLDRFLIEVKNVELGKTGIDAWRTQLDKANFRNVTLVCKGEVCSTSWRTDNEPLHKLQLAPLTGVLCEVSFKGGVASQIYVWVEVANTHEARGLMSPGSGATVNAISDAESCHKEYSADIKQNGGYHWAIVKMDSCVSSSEKAKAFAINTGCLMNIGGCKSGEAILPKVFDRM